MTSHSFQPAKLASSSATPSNFSHHLPPPLPPPPPTSSSPCAACKFLRRKCQPECVFAPYFLADQPQKFISVHRVFGASNVTKLLNEIPPRDREDAVNSLAYEADMRLRDPVYGCVGVISILYQEFRKLQFELSFARAELARYQTVAAAGSLQFAGAPTPDLGHGPLLSGFEPSRTGVNGAYDGEAESVTGLRTVGGQFGKLAAVGIDEKRGVGPA